jgi:hypothetical protein
MGVGIRKGFPLAASDGIELLEDAECVRDAPNTESEADGRDIHPVGATADRFRPGFRHTWP